MPDCRTGRGGTIVRILIADDREIVRKTLRDVISRADGAWEMCGEAADGQQAFDRAVQLTPDLIILDVAMPVLDGIKATRKIRTALPEVPILLYTFLSLPHLEKMAKEAGAQGVVEKGDARVLIAEIRRVLAGAAALRTETIAAQSVAQPIAPQPTKAAAGDLESTELDTDSPTS